MPAGQGMLWGAPLTRSIIDELRRRPGHLVVFVSSRMRGDVLKAERDAVVEAVNRTGLARAWTWERDACAGPYSAARVCVEHARNSDALALILAEDLTPVTRREYHGARGQGVPCFILLKDGVQRDSSADAFVRRQQNGGMVTRAFSDTTELQSHVIGALYSYVVNGTRLENIRRRIRCGGQ